MSDVKQNWSEVADRLEALKRKLDRLIAGAVTTTVGKVSDDKRQAVRKR